MEGFSRVFKTQERVCLAFTAVHVILLTCYVDLGHE